MNLLCDAATPEAVASAIAWLDLIWKPVMMALAVYWIFWHKSERKRFEREDAGRFASAEDVTRIAHDLERHQEDVRRQINKIYDQMREDAKHVAGTFQTFAREVAKVEGQLLMARGGRKSAGGEV